MFGLILMVAIGLYFVYEGCCGILEQHNNKKNKEE